MTKGVRSSNSTNQRKEQVMRKFEVGDKPTKEHAARQLEADLRRLATKWNAKFTKETAK